VVKCSKFKGQKMKKLIVGLFILFAITTFSNAKTYTTEGVYAGSRCSDMCYLLFNTKRGEIALYGYADDYKNIRKGRRYKVAYEDRKISLADFGKIKVKAVTKIRSIGKTKHSSKKKGRYLSYIKKECKSFGPPYCYLVKRYSLFQRECQKGDHVSCENIKDMDEAIGTNDLQSVHYFSNTAKTGRGK
jgi:hypothetical protein